MGIGIDGGVAAGCAAYHHETVTGFETIWIYPLPAGCLAGFAVFAYRQS